MNVPYGLNILENCTACPATGNRLFCKLSQHAMQRLNEIKSTAIYPRGAMLFLEGQKPRGVFVLLRREDKTFDFFPRRQNHHHKNLRGGRCSWTECGVSEPSL